jgi:deazaflavin-dependent oxidoreductase (nitroreductase family)
MRTMRKMALLRPIGPFAAGGLVAWLLIGRRPSQVRRHASHVRVPGSDPDSDRVMFPMQPSAWLIGIFRAPVLLYRLGLGRLLGHRLLMLRHRGRRTGATHETVLEVVHYDPITRESVVVSAWGERADWFRSIRAHPPLEVTTGRERYIPCWRELRPDESFDVLSDYMRRLPSPLRPFARRAGLDLGRTEEERRAHASHLLVVGFRPQETAGSPAAEWMSGRLASPVCRSC